jgi:hypothetical protein
MGAAYSVMEDYSHTNKITKQIGISLLHIFEIK